MTINGLSRKGLVDLVQDFDHNATLHGNPTVSGFLSLTPDKYEKIKVVEFADPENVSFSEVFDAWQELDDERDEKVLAEFMQRETESDLESELIETKKQLKIATDKLEYVYNMLDTPAEEILGGI